MDVDQFLDDDVSYDEMSMLEARHCWPTLEAEFCNQFADQQKQADIDLIEEQIQQEQVEKGVERTNLDYKPVYEKEYRAIYSHQREKSDIQCMDDVRRSVVKMKDDIMKINANILLMKGDMNRLKQEVWNLRARSDHIDKFLVQFAKK